MFHDNQSVRMKGGDAGQWKDQSGSISFSCLQAAVLSSSSWIPPAMVRDVWADLDISDLQEGSQDTETTTAQDSSGQSNRVTFKTYNKLPLTQFYHWKLPQPLR